MTARRPRTGCTARNRAGRGPINVDSATERLPQPVTAPAEVLQVTAAFQFPQHPERLRLRQARPPRHRPQGGRLPHPGQGLQDLETARGLLPRTALDDSRRAGTRRVGCPIAWWTLDHAARTGYEHVRRGCGYHELMRYYRDIQGWQLAHTVDRRGVTAYLLTRPAERMPDIADRIIEQYLPA